MNAGLRRRHRIWTRMLAIAIPLGFVVAIAARQPPPVVDSLPVPIAETLPSGTEPLWDRSDLFTELPLRVRRFPGGQLELTPERHPRRPDVLAYWAPSSAASDRLPENAYLLGRLSGRETRVMALPGAARGRGGFLFLYSLGHQELLDHSALPEPRS